MKKMLLFAAILSSAMLLNAAETYQSAYSAAHKLLKAKKYAEAAAKFAEAGKLATKQTDKYWSACYETTACLDGKMFDKAIVSNDNQLKIALATGKQVGDQQARACWQRALILNYKGDYANSVEFYKKAAALADKKYWIYSNSTLSAAGILNSKLRKPQEAAALYKELFDCKEADPNTRINGLFQYTVMAPNQKNAPANLKLLENAEKLSPKLNNSSFAGIWDARGRNLQALGKYDDAIKAFNETVKYTEPDSSYRAFAYNSIMWSYLCKKDKANAAKYAQLCLDCKKATWGRDVRLCKQTIAEYQKSLKK